MFSLNIKMNRLQCLFSWAISLQVIPPPLLSIDKVSVQFSVAQDYTHLRGYFDKLASMILSFPVLAQTSHFVFVPGPTDPGGDVVNVLPKAPLAKAFTKLLRERLPNAHFTSNPARYINSFAEI